MRDSMISVDQDLNLPKYKSLVLLSLFLSLIIIFSFSFPLISALEISTFNNTTIYTRGIMEGVVIINSTAINISTTQHNALAGLQGGSPGEYYHINLTEYNLLSNLTINITNISYHNLLNNLEWSVAGHTIDTNLDINNNDIQEIDQAFFSSYDWISSDDLRHIDIHANFIDLHGNLSSIWRMWLNADGDGYGGDSHGDLIFGTSGDAYIYYNGSDLIIDPDAVGSGDVVILGDIRADNFIGNFSGLIDGVNVSNLTGYVPYTGAIADVDLGNHNLTLNRTLIFPERIGATSDNISNLLMVGPYNMDGFRMEYWYNFEAANDDWLVFRKTDGNDERPDGGIAFMWSNATGYNKTILKLDGYDLANFTTYSIITIGNISATNINVTDFLNVTGNITSGTHVPKTNSTYSLGSSVLRWLKGWFYELDVLGNASITGNLNVTGNIYLNGNVSMKRPYGMYSSTETQTIAVINTPQAITFNWTEDSYLINKDSINKTNFTFLLSGDYLIELSAIMQTVTPGDRVQIWVQKNGVNIPRSNTIYDFKANGANAVLSVPFILDMNAGDTFRVMMAGSATDIKMMYYTNTSYSPETPSIIMTISKISEITI